jgi:hypothetical protein
MSALQMKSKEGLLSVFIRLQLSSCVQFSIKIFDKILILAFTPKAHRNALNNTFIRGKKDSQTTNNTKKGFEVSVLNRGEKTPQGNIWKYIK